MYGKNDRDPWNWPAIAKEWNCSCGYIEAMIEGFTKPPEEVGHDALATFHRLEGTNRATIGKRQPETREELRRVLIAQFKMWATMLEGIK